MRWHEPAGALRRADMDDEIDVAPVDAEIERRGARPRRGACPAAIAASTLRRCADIERAVMQRDRQIVVVDAPQLLEQHLGLRARVDEDQRHAVRLIAA